MPKKRKVIIMGAAGTDFHIFNTFFRHNSNYEVVAFTQTSEQNIGELPDHLSRTYPPSLSGRRYPHGIHIFPEKQLSHLIKRLDVDEVVLAYHDLSYEEVMHKSAVVMAAGADFKLMGPKSRTLTSKKPVIAVTGVRTGVGKSPTTRRVVKILKGLGMNAVVIRHPMPYGNLKKMEVQRFSSRKDLDDAKCTIEEREEYQPHIEAGTVVYSGVDYGKILKKAEREADIIVWDGGNNDIPFIKPDLHIVVVDSRRPGHELSYFSGEVNLRMADIVVITKVDTAKPRDIDTVVKNIVSANPKATIIKTAMNRIVDRPDLVRGKRVLVVEDGPTITHGGLAFGAGTIVAKSLGAFMINPRTNAVGSIKDVYQKYPHIGSVLPAMGYSKKQIEELEKTIDITECDSVIIATPFDIRNLFPINKPVVRVRYEIREVTKPDLDEIIKKFLKH